MTAAALRAPAAAAPLSAAAQLHAARELLARPGTWLPGLSFRAVDRAGAGVPCRSDRAVRFGVLAALVRVAGPEEERRRAVACLAKAAAAASLHAWEEEPARTEAEVLALLGDAVALAARGGP